METEESNKNWKFITFNLYKKLLSDVIATLDFGYPIEQADKGIEYWIEFGRRTINNFNDFGACKWRTIFVLLVEKAEEAIKLDNPTRRSEAYYGLANFVTDSIDMESFANKEIED